MKQVQKNYMVPVLCSAIILGISGISAKKDNCSITENITQDMYVNLYESYAEAKQTESQDICMLYEITDVEECAEVFDFDTFEYNIKLEDYEKLYEAELEEWTENYINSLFMNATYIQ